MGYLGLLDRRSLRWRCSFGCGCLERSLSYMVRPPPSLWAHVMSELQCRFDTVYEGTCRASWSSQQRSWGWYDHFRSRFWQYPNRPLVLSIPPSSSRIPSSVVVVVVWTMSRKMCPCTTGNSGRGWPISPESPRQIERITTSTCGRVRVGWYQYSIN